MIKAIIIEDEEIAAQRLKELVEETNYDILVIARLSSVAESIKYLNYENPDLIFLDINLSDGNAFEIFKTIKVNVPIIFTTAYSEYAVKAFEQNSIDYLLKPVSRDALSKAIKKYIGLNQVVPDYSDLLKINNPEYQTRFLIKKNQRLISLNVGDIAYFYSEDKLTFIKMQSGQQHVFDYSLKKLEEVLDPSVFFKINRKYIIHVKSLKDMFYTSKSKIKVILSPKPSDDLIFVAVEKLGKFKNWLSI